MKTKLFYMFIGAFLSLVLVACAAQVVAQTYGLTVVALTSREDSYRVDQLTYHSPNRGG